MRQSIQALLSTLIALFFLCACAEDIPAKDRIVVLVTIDGFPGWIWRDASLTAPTLKKLAAGGSMGTMTISNPTVTWPNHTTLVTGVPCSKHGVLFNGMLTRQGPGKPVTFEPQTDKSLFVRVPTIYDAAFKAGLITAQVDWVAIQNSGTINWEFTEYSDPKGKVEQELVAANLVAQADIDGFRRRNIVFKDDIWTRAAEHIIEQHHPNLLLFHLLSTDANNHKYGPGTLPSFTAYAYDDTCIKRILDALNAAGYKDKFTLIVTTDHGFKTVHRVIRPDVLLRKEGLLKRSGPTVTHCDVISKTAGGSTMLFITDPAKKAELTPKLKELFGSVEGVAHIYEPSEYAAIGLPLPSENEQSGDLLLAAKPDYAFSDSFAEGNVVVDVTADPSGYIGNHGYLNDDPQLEGIFIAYGYGIKPGVPLDHISNQSVAPTIAKLLGIQLPSAEGKVLGEILK